MMITKMAIPRRTVLRGLGATLALPLLDSMVPAFASTQGVAAPVKRLGVVYVPNGVVMKNWTPATEGALELSPTLAPLAPYKDRVLVLSGLNSKPPAGLTGANIGVHARASTRFLTDVPPKHTNNAEIHAGVSMDQMFAKQAGRAHAARLAGARARRARLRRLVRRRLQLRLLEHHRLELADDAAADGAQPAGRVRAAVRRRRQHRSRRRGSRASRRTAACSTR